MSKYEFSDNGYAVTLSSSSGMSARLCLLERSEFLQIIDETKDDYLDPDSPWDYESLEDGIDHIIANYFDDLCMYCDQITGNRVCSKCEKIHGGDA